MEQARAAKDKLGVALSGHAAVNGIGIAAAEGGYALAVNLRRQLERGESIPQSVDGVPVETRVIGEIRKLGLSADIS
jgi:hypothetical protein